MTTKIPLAIPSISENEKNAVLEVLNSGWLAPGNYNKEFEKQFAEFIGVKHAIAMNSATSALEIALKVNNIKGEVIVPSFTFVASANSIVTSGARPVFCDVDLETRNVTAAHIAPLINKKTEAVMVVHFGGQVCQMDEIVELCNKHNLLLIEDSAETLGATWNSKQAGSFGISCFSFFPTKNITTGEGGMFCCNDDDTASKARAIIGHGITSTTFSREKEERPWYRSAIMPGHNYRMSNILAAIGVFQLQKLNDMNEKRRVLANEYTKLINQLNLDIKTPFTHQSATHVYQMYTIHVDKNIRNKLVMFLRAKGIGASVHFDPPVHLQAFYKENFPIIHKLPNTEQLSESLITLPLYPDMKIQDVRIVVETINNFF